MPMPRPLDGLRVVDFTWVRAGPWATRWLGAMGAEVIKVEWPQNLDPFRQNRGNEPPGVEPGPNSSGTFADTNANKVSVTVNMRSEHGMELLRELISISDVVIENFSSRVMRRRGLGYEELRMLRPDVIYVSMAGLGQEGRDHAYTTMGPSAQALSGMTYLSGLPDEPPAGWGWSYMDDSGGMYGLICVLTALRHRDVTGEGQHVDLSQMTVGITLTGSAFLDRTVNGRPFAARRLSAGQPHGVAGRAEAEQLPGRDGRAAQLVPHRGRRLQRLVRDRVFLGRRMARVGGADGKSRLGAGRGIRHAGGAHRPAGRDRRGHRALDADAGQVRGDGTVPGRGRAGNAGPELRRSRRERSAA